MESEQHPKKDKMEPTFYNAAMQMLESGLFTLDEVHLFLRMLATAAVMENPAIGDMPLVPLKTLTLTGTIHTLSGLFNKTFLQYMNILSNQLFLACSTHFELPRVATNAETGSYSITFTFDAPISLNNNLRMMEVVNTVKVNDITQTLGAIQREYAF